MRLSLVVPCHFYMFHLNADHHTTECTFQLWSVWLTFNCLSKGLCNLHFHISSVLDWKRLKCEISDNKHSICGKLVLPLTYQNGCATLWWTCSFVSFYLLTAFLTTITQHTIWAWRHFYFEILLWSNLHQYRCAHIKTCYWNKTCLEQSVQFFYQSFNEWNWFNSPDIFT